MYVFVGMNFEPDFDAITRRLIVTQNIQLHFDTLPFGWIVTLIQWVLIVVVLSGVLSLIKWNEFYAINDFNERWQLDFQNFLVRRQRCWHDMRRLMWFPAINVAIEDFMYKKHSATVASNEAMSTWKTDDNDKC